MPGTNRTDIQEAPEVYLEDETWTILLNADCDEQNVSPRINDFLRFIRTGEVDKDSGDFTRKLQAAVINARQQIQWGEEYMKWKDELKYTFYQGKEEGKEEERKNTEAERKRADEEHRKAEAAERLLAKYKERFGELETSRN